MTTTVRATLATMATALLLAGCSGGGADLMDGPAAGGRAAEPADSRAESQADAAGRNTGDASDDATQPADAGPELGRDIIRTARLTVRTERVAAAADEARSIVRRAGGIVSAEDTSAGGSRERRRSVLTLRVPANRYAEVLDSLGQLGRVQRQETSSDDVSLQVIDVESRIASSERALVRLRELLDRAESLSDVVSLENELQRREADLEALKGQQAYLDDQTSLSTITLTLRRPAEKEEPEAAPAGFLAGLSTGWGSLTGMLSFVVTAVGVLLPFLVLAVLLMLPLWLALRRLRLSDRGAVHEVDDPA